MNELEYQQLEGVNISRLKTMLQSPKKYHDWKWDNKITPARLFGKELHKRVFLPGPPKLDEDIVIFEGVRRGQAWKRFQEEHVGQVIMTASEHAHRLEEDAEVEEMARSIKSHPVVAKLLTNGHTEHVIAWQTEDLPCKARLDWCNAKRIVDLKTTTDAGTHFERDIEKYGYWLQGAWYQYGWAQTLKISPQSLSYFIIAVEKDAPYDLQIFKLDQNGLDNAWQECLDLLAQVKHCEATQSWPGYSEYWRTITRGKRGN